MAIAKSIESYLKKAKITVEVVPHKKVFTVYDLAQTLKEKFDNIAKTLLVKADKQYFLVVMPANYRLDEKKFKQALAVKKVGIASEKEMSSRFKVKPGAMTPFGAIHKLEVITDKSLLKATSALFGAGSFTESLRLKVKDYLKVAVPRIENIAYKIPLKLQVIRKPAKSKPKKRVQRKKR